MIFPRAMRRVPDARRRLAVLASVLLAAAPFPASATPAPPLAPCVALPATTTIAALRAIVAGGSEVNYRVRDCAATDLAARGAPAIPVALGLLEARDGDTVRLALAVLARMGPGAQPALPTLVRLIEQPPAVLGTHYGPIYAAVGAIGAPASSAIPLLIARSEDPAHRYAAFAALGQLGKVDPGRVVPHLVAMMERPFDPDMSLDAPLALEALREIGEPARIALPAIRASLERARTSGTNMHLAAAERALAALTPKPPTASQ